MANIHLSKIDPNPPEDLDKHYVKKHTKKMQQGLDELQNKLYAGHQHSILIVLQGMDASGKDGAVRNVFESINPQGVSVHSFKVPTEEELSHDFLWRIHKQTPGKGMIQIFNRSYYEDILVTRVHKMIDTKTAKKRIKAINDFEQLLAENYTHILKFYLHISKEEQTERLNERLTIPKKMWKYNSNDFKEAEYWNDYQKFYEDCFNLCNEVPWIIVPANKNWYKEFVVTEALYNLLKKLNLKYPTLENNKI